MPSRPADGPAQTTPASPAPCPKIHIPPPLELSQVNFRAGRKELLAQTDLRVLPGEFVGILGPNGAGKSTLLALANATLRPSSGELRLMGENPWKSGARRRASLRARVGSLLQRSDYSTLIPLSVREVVAMGRLGMRLRPNAEDDERVDSALRRLAISHLAARAYRSLSGGEQQKVQLARALAQEPELLLLDEPTTGLDMDWQERLVELIGELAESPGAPAVLMTTHLLSSLPACCRRVILLRQGRVLFDGPAAEALTPARLEELYGCPVEILERAGRRYCLAAAGAQIEGTP